MEEEDTKALEDRLRKKYSSASPGAKSNIQRIVQEIQTTKVTPSRESAGIASKFQLNVHLCVVCKGEGKEVIHYNSRLLEKTCEECEGVGTITTKNGVKISDEEATAIRVQESNQPEDKIQVEILKLQSMQSEYEKEVAALEATVSSSTGEKKELHEKVLGQVRVMLERVKGAINFKKNRKGKLQREKEKQLKQRIMENLRKKTGTS